MMRTLPCHSPARGTLLFTYTLVDDGLLLRGSGPGGSLDVMAERGRLVLAIDAAERSARIELDDAYPVDDGHPHTVALTVDESGTRVYVDGGLEMVSTQTAFLGSLGITRLSVADDALAHVSDVEVRDDVLEPRIIRGLSPLPQPHTTFAMHALAPEDACALAALTSGTIALRFRTRGVGQQGVICAAGHGSEQVASLAVTADRLEWRVASTDGERVWVAPGAWSRGDWHDVAIRCGGGATDIYVDGQRVTHAPGCAFFAETTGVDQMVIGQDIFGDRLFGEVATLDVYDRLLTEGHIRHLARVPDRPLVPVFDRGFHGAASYRIPSLIALPTGRLVAGADQRLVIPNDAPNEIHFVVRTSDDGGATWSDMATVWAYPGGGREGASLIDSCLVFDPARERLHVLIDHFPGGIGQFNSVPGTGFDGEGRLTVLGDEGVYRVSESGDIVTENGEATGYTVDADLLVTGPAGATGHLYDAAGTGHPFRMVPTSYLLHLYSDDGGETWSRPRHLNADLKDASMTFLGTGPGAGICIEAGPHRGRLVIPYYASEATGRFFSAGALFSDDGGETWQRGLTVVESSDAEAGLDDLSDKTRSTYEAAIVECSDGRLLILMRNQHPSGRVGVAYSDDGGASWGEVTYHPELPEIFSQPHALGVTTSRGRALVFANATRLLPFRGEGVVRVSFDDGATWPGSVTIKSGHYVYQCLAEMGEGTVGILWENEWQGLYFTTLSIESVPMATPPGS